MRTLKVKCLAILCLLLISAPAWGYVSIKSGPQQKQTTWANPSIKWWIDVGSPPGVTNADALAALQAAFDSWSSVSCAQASFVYMGPSNSPQNDAIYINFEPNEWDPSVDGAAAFTVSEKKQNGNIEYSIIVFNAVDIAWTTVASESDWGTKSDVQGVASHEIGHALGLDHPWVRNATMFFSGGSAALRSLDADDERGLCYLYPTTAFSSGQVCDSCESNTDCANNVCLAYVNEFGNGFCGSSCSNNSDCPNQFDCQPVQGAGDQCVPTYEYCTHFGSNVPIGGYCWGNQMCSSGNCIPLQNDAYCTQSCAVNNSNSCPAGYKCLGNNTNGFCLKVGDKAFGDECQSPLECATAICYAGQCTEKCTPGDGCPNGTQCLFDHCFPPGAKYFGEECNGHLDCQTYYCAGIFEKFCSYECTSDNDCPGASQCTSAGHCSDLNLATKGDLCEEDSACLPGMTCIMNGPGNLGHCHMLCDPFADTGCGGADECAWFYEPAQQIIRGGCIDPGAGSGHTDGCGGSLGDCQDHLICAALTSIEGTCVRDCRTTDKMGCEDWEDCFSLNDPSDPQHGACISNGTPPPPADNGTQPVDQGVGTDPGSSSVSEDTLTIPDLSGSTDTAEHTEKSGCTASNHSTKNQPLSLALGCLSLMAWFITRQRKQLA